MSTSCDAFAPRPSFQLVWIVLFLFAFGNITRSSGNLDFVEKVFYLVVFGAEWDLDIIDEHLHHARDTVGIRPQNIRVIVQAEAGIHSVYPKLLSKAVAKCENFGIRNIRVWKGEYTSKTMMGIRAEVRSRIPQHAWIVHADSDEFHNVTSGDLELLDSQGYNAAYGLYIDRLAPNLLIQNTTGSSLQEDFPLFCPLCRNVARIPCQKVVAYRNHLHPNRGSGRLIEGPPFKSSKQQSISNVSVFPYFFAVHHFKWRGDVLAKLRRRVQTYKRLRYGWWKQSATFLNALSDGKLKQSRISSNSCVDAKSVPQLVGSIPLLEGDFTEWSSSRMWPKDVVEFTPAAVEIVRTDSDLAIFKFYKRRLLNWTTDDLARTLRLENSTLEDNFIRLKAEKK